MAAVLHAVLTFIIPYIQATPAQRQQALLSARQIFDVTYPHFDRAQWVAALEQTQPPLLVLPDQPVQLTHDGLAALAFHLAPVAEQAAATVPIAFPGQPVPKPAERSKKQTYAVPLDVCWQLDNVHYWCRIPITRLVIAALRQYLGQYPEAQHPRPDRGLIPPPT